MNTMLRDRLSITTSPQMTGRTSTSNDGARPTYRGATRKLTEEERKEVKKGYGRPYNWR